GRGVRPSPSATTPVSGPSRPRPSTISIPEVRADVVQPREKQDLLSPQLSKRPIATTSMTTMLSAKAPELESATAPLPKKRWLRRRQYRKLRVLEFQKRLQK